MANSYGNKLAHQNYTAVQVSTIDRGRLLLMMFDGGTKFLSHAKEGLENKDIVKFARFLSKGQAIIAELMNTLDYEAGGQIAVDLERLYDFMLFYLTEANMQKSATKVQKVIELLDTIGGAYRQIIEGKDVSWKEVLEQASRQSSEPRTKPTESKMAPTEVRQFRVAL